MSDQIALPTVVTEVEVAREKSLGGAIELCAKAAGFSLDKELRTERERAEKAESENRLLRQLLTGRTS